MVIHFLFERVHTWQTKRKQESACNQKLVLHVLCYDNYNQMLKWKCNWLHVLPQRLQFFCFVVKLLAWIWPNFSDSTHGRIWLSEDTMSKFCVFLLNHFSEFLFAQNWSNSLSFGWLPRFQNWWDKSSCKLVRVHKSNFQQQKQTMKNVTSRRKHNPCIIHTEKDNGNCCCFCFCQLVLLATASFGNLVASDLTATMNCWCRKFTLVGSHSWENVKLCGVPFCFCDRMFAVHCTSTQCDAMHHGTPHQKMLQEEWKKHPPSSVFFFFAQKIRKSHHFLIVDKMGWCGCWSQWFVVLSLKMKSACATTSKCGQAKFVSNFCQIDSRVWTNCKSNFAAAFTIQVNVMCNFASTFDANAFSKLLKLWLQHFVCKMCGLT